MQINFPPHRRRSGASVGVATRGTPVTQDVETVSSAVLFSKNSAAAGVDPQDAREMADTIPWVKTAIDRIKLKVVRADRGVFPINPTKPFDLDLQARLTYLLENPNPKGESWRTFIEPVVKDYLTIAKGGWEYVPNFMGFPLALYSFDAKFLHIDPSWDGSQPKAPRYSWRPPGKKEAKLRSDQLTVLIDDPSTHRTEGWSKLAVLKRTLESDAAGDDYVRSLLEKYTPPGWLDLGKTATAKDVRAVSNKLNQSVLGRGGMLVTGNLDGPKHTNLWAGGSRENELREWSEYFGRKVAIVFGLSPMDLGLTADLNKASAGVAQDVSGEDGAISVLSYIEEMWNREVIGKFGTPEEVNLALRFKDVTWAERERRAKIVASLAGTMPVYQLNELRDLTFLPPISGGNAIWFGTRLGPIPVLGEDAGLYNATTAMAGAEDEDAEGKAGGEGQEKVTPVDDKGDTAATVSPEQSGNSGNKAPAGSEAAAAASSQRGLVEPLVQAYLRMWSGSVEWTLELDAVTVRSAQEFVVRMLTVPESNTPFALRHAAAKRDRIVKALAPVTSSLPAYMVSEYCSEAAAKAA